MFTPIEKKTRLSKMKGMKGKPDKTTHVLGVPIEKSKRKHPEEMPKRGRGRPSGSKNVRGGSIIALPELKQQATVMIRKLYEEIEDGSATSKNVTAAWANVVDKWAMLSGRPTEIIGYTEVEKQRPGIIRLAERIAMNRKKESA